MLPTRLLSYRHTGDGVVVPTWLTSRDDVWLRELAAEAGASDGRRVDVADERILDLVAPIARRHGAARRVVEAVWFVERRRWKTRVDSPVPPERIRRVVFDLAAERARDEALATAAHELGIEVAAVESSLFADRAHARKLISPGAACSAVDLGAAYNLALVQALLGRSTDVIALVRANLHSVVRYAKLLGLMAQFDETADGATRMTVSGPLALFHDTLKYGRALARWFPAVVATPGWSVEARVILGGETLRLALDGSSPLPRTHALPLAHDSKLEARLEKDLRRLTSPWKIERESAVVRAGGRLFFPDFSLVSARGRVLVEIAGFWTPEYLVEKAALLRAANVPLVMCADERHAQGALASDPRVVLFRRSVDAASLIDACERALVSSREVVVAGRLDVEPSIVTSAVPTPVQPVGYRETRHYVVIPASPSIEEYAVRSGARATHWRQDVFDDLTTGGEVRAIALETRFRVGSQVGIVGHTFYAEASIHHRRDDALSVYRVMPLAKRPAGTSCVHAGAFQLLDPRLVQSAPRVDRIVDLFAAFRRQPEPGRR